MACNANLLREKKTYITSPLGYPVRLYKLKNCERYYKSIAVPKHQRQTGCGYPPYKKKHPEPKLGVEHFINVIAQDLTFGSHGLPSTASWHISSGDTPDGTGDIIPVSQSVLRELSLSDS